MTPAKVTQDGKLTEHPFWCGPFTRFAPFIPWIFHVSIERLNTMYV